MTYAFNERGGEIVPNLIFSDSATSGARRSTTRGCDHTGGSRTFPGLPTAAWLTQSRKLSRKERRKCDGESPLLVLVHRLPIVVQNASERGKGVRIERAVGEMHLVARRIVEQLV